MNDKPPRPPKDWTPSASRSGAATPPVNPDSAPAAA
jgi:cell division protease FtsH